MTQSTEAYVPDNEYMTYPRETYRSEESPLSEYSKYRSKELTWSEYVERQWNLQDTKITISTTSSEGENSEDNDGSVNNGDSLCAVSGDAVMDLNAAVDATMPLTDANPSADRCTQAFIYALCAEEIVKIVERAMHQELVALRMDRGLVINTATQCVCLDVDDSMTSPRDNVL